MFLQLRFLPFSGTNMQVDYMTGRWQMVTEVIGLFSLHICSLLDIKCDMFHLIDNF